MELCLLGLKGSPPEGAELRKHINVIMAQRRLHSQKPEEQYTIAEGLCPFGPRLELFGRHHNLRAGWVTAGNEVDQLVYNEAYPPKLKRFKGESRIDGPQMNPEEDGTEGKNEGKKLEMTDFGDSS
jgi:N6-adenosine-specific RNA methylase IME4